MFWLATGGYLYGLFHAFTGVLLVILISDLKAVDFGLMPNSLSALSEHGSEDSS